MQVLQVGIFDRGEELNAIFKKIDRYKDQIDALRPLEGIMLKQIKDDRPFVKFIAERVEENQKDLLRLLK